MTDRIDGYQPLGNSTKGTLPPKGGSGVPNKNNHTAEYYTGVPNTSGSLYCPGCGTKTYLAENGTHRGCDDMGIDMNGLPCPDGKIAIPNQGHQMITSEYTKFVCACEASVEEEKRKEQLFEDTADKQSKLGDTFRPIIKLFKYYCPVCNSKLVKLFCYKEKDALGTVSHYILECSCGYKYAATRS